MFEVARGLCEGVSKLREGKSEEGIASLREATSEKFSDYLCVSRLGVEFYRLEGRDAKHWSGPA
jgi:hypothetical protein